MSAANHRPSENPLLTDDVRRYLASLKGGWMGFSSEKRALLTRMNSKRIWATRRARYGPTGRRPRSYHAWRVEHGLPAIGDDGRPVSDSLTKPID